MATVYELLERLADDREDLESLRADAAAEEEKIIRPVADRLAACRKAWAKRIEVAEKRAAAAEAKARAAVVAHGETVENDRLRAVYCKPRTSWNNDKLEVLIAVYPAVATARTVAAEGSVQIRGVK